jgi:hypothetical protein
MLIYTSIGFKGLREILTIFTNVSSYSSIAVVAILTREGLLGFFSLHHPSHTPIAIPSQYIDRNENYFYEKWAHLTRATFVLPLPPCPYFEVLF